MNQGKLAEGLPVRITAGPYKGIEGVIDDLDPECSAARVYTKEEGSAYALLNQMQIIVKPTNIGSQKALRRR
jgi:transcription antitermination factor NusG